jgi:hypothetical protein
LNTRQHLMVLKVKARTLKVLIKKKSPYIIKSVLRKLNAWTSIIPLGSFLCLWNLIYAKAGPINSIIAYSAFIIFISYEHSKRRLILMAHCPSCGKEVNKPSRVQKNYSFTIQAYDCGKCHHNFKVTLNQSWYIA